MTLTVKLKPNIQRGFDKPLQTDLSMGLYLFITNLKLDEGDSFQHVVRVNYNRDGAK